MWRPMSTANDTALAGALRARGQRVTSQRLVLHRILRDLDRHVTAEELARRAAEQLPGVSLPTVYATLALFEELGIVRRVAAEGAVLYDPRTDAHHHVRCSRCGRIEDLDAPLEDASVLAAAEEAGYEADRTEVVVVGVCPDCRGRAGEATAGSGSARRDVRARRL